MVTLTQAEKDELERAVSRAETRTSAEIVLSVAEICDDYRVHTFPYAALIGLVVFGALALLMPNIHVRMAFLATAGAIILAGLVLQLRPLRLLTAPRAAREEAAERLAQAEFAALVAGRTSAANGILIFVALAERRADIAVEPGLAARVPQQAWDKIMADLVAALAAGEAVVGLKAAIEACAEAAAAVFPPAAGDRDEIANAPHEAGAR